MATYLIGNVKGPKGEDGYSPRASVQQTSNGAVITVEDQTGITSAFIRDGVDADGNNIDLTVYATKVELQNEIDDLADTYATKTELEDIDIGVISVNNMTGDVIIPPTDLTGYATEAWIQQQGYMTSAPVVSVNGQTETVVLDAEDVGALPDDTVIPTKVSDLTNDSNFVSSATLNSLLQGKQDTLTAGNNITITNNVISASGGFSGDYDDLTNKPDLSVYAESADLATVATTGDYTDLSNTPTIPTALSAGDGIVIDNDEISLDLEWYSNQHLDSNDDVDSTLYITNDPANTNAYDSPYGITLFDGDNAVDGTNYISISQKDAQNAGLGINFGNVIVDSETGDVRLEASVSLYPNANGRITDHGNVLAYTSDIPAAELPALTNNAGKVLTVNSGETGVEWTTPSGGGSYTAGDGVDITNDEINVLADGTTIGFNASNQLAIVASYTPLNVYQAGIASKQDKLRAGSNISISDSNVISAVDTTYSAGTGISISNNVISATGGITEADIQDGLTIESEHQSDEDYLELHLGVDDVFVTEYNADGQEIGVYGFGYVTNSEYSEDNGDTIRTSLNGGINSDSLNFNKDVFNETQAQSIENKTIDIIPNFDDDVIEVSINDSINDTSDTYTLATTDYVDDVLPTEPSANGTYFLTATVSSGTVTKAWTSIPAANGNSF